MRPGTFVLGRRFDFLNKEPIMIQLEDKSGLGNKGNSKDKNFKIGLIVEGLPMSMHLNKGLTNYRTKIRI
jgi:hypothetical protein